jgi:hypothetical protein
MSCVRHCTDFANLPFIFTDFYIYHICIWLSITSEYPEYFFSHVSESLILIWNLVCNNRLCASLPTPVALAILLIVKCPHNVSYLIVYIYHSYFFTPWYPWRKGYLLLTLLDFVVYSVGVLVIFDCRGTVDADMNGIVLFAYYTLFSCTIHTTSDSIHDIRQCTRTFWITLWTHAKLPQPFAIIFAYFHLFSLISDVLFNFWHCNVAIWLRVLK